MLFSDDQRSFCIIWDALRMIGIDTTICIEEIVERIENVFLTRLLGRGARPSNPSITSKVSTPHQPHDACHMGVYRSPATFWVPFVQFCRTLATVHNLAHGGHRSLIFSASEPQIGPNGAQIAKNAISDHVGALKC